MTTVFEAIISKLDTLNSEIKDLQRIEFPVYVDGDGDGVAGRIAEWVDANSIQAANLIGPASNVLSLEAGGNYTLTVNATGAATLGAGTLSVSSSNDAGIANHTHAITTSSNPGSNARILASTASGGLTLESLTVGSLTVPTSGTLARGAGTLTVSTSNDASGTAHTHAITTSNNPGANARILASTSSGGLTLESLITAALTVGSHDLVLTRGLTVQGNNNGVLNFGGAYTLTIPATGTAAVGAGQLTYATSNDVSTNAHTHDIATSSNPGSNARILQSDASGGLTLQALDVGSLTVPTTGTLARGAGTLTVSTSNDASGTSHTHAITTDSTPADSTAVILATSSNGDINMGGWFRAQAGLGAGSGSAPAYTADIAGACHASSFPTSSDIRLKTNIAPILNALDGIKQVQPVFFEWNEYYENLGRGVQGKQNIGMIAQELETVFPQLISIWDHPKKFKAIDYNRAVAVVWAGLRELEARVAALEGA